MPRWVGLARARTRVALVSLDATLPPAGRSDARSSDSRRAPPRTPHADRAALPHSCWHA
jgi:hypothetical protein